MADQDKVRAERVRALRRRRYDDLPSPPIATGLIARDSGVGPAPGKRVPCDLCLRSGHVLRRELGGKVVRRLCPLCEGSGWRKRRPGDEEWDEYLERPLRGPRKPQEPFRLADDIRRLSAEIERLEANEAAREGSYEHERYGWEAEKRRMNRLGSYRDLERLLRDLFRDWPTAYWVLYLVYWRGLPLRLSRAHQDLEERAVVWLSERMPEEIRVPAWHAEADLQSVRQKRIVHELAAEGMSPGKIAFVVGLTRKKVKRILGAV